MGSDEGKKKHWWNSLARSRALDKVAKSLDKLVKLDRASVASLVAGICVIASLAWAFKTNNSDIISLILGASIGYLLKEAGV